MLIITLRTDRPDAEIGLYDDDKQLAYLSWQAHRKLAETLHFKIKQILDDQKKSFSDLEGIVIYKGPGSFTGLRIGFSVANALADSLQIPIDSQTNDNWIEAAIANLKVGKNEMLTLPDYGADPRVTTAKK